MGKHEWARPPSVAGLSHQRPAPSSAPGLPPSNHGSGAAGDITAAPGFLEGCTQVVYSQWGPSPSPSSASRCLRDPRLVVSTGPPMGQQSPCLSWLQSGCLQPHPLQVGWPGPQPLHQPLPNLLLSPCPTLATMPPAPPRSPSVKTLRKDKELQSTPLKASDGSRLLSRSRTWRTWIRASRTVYGSVGREVAGVTRALLPATTRLAWRSLRYHGSP